MSQDNCSNSDIDSFKKTVFFCTLIVGLFAVLGLWALTSTSSALIDNAKKKHAGTLKVVSESINAPLDERISVTERTVTEDEYGRPTVLAKTKLGDFYAVPSANAINDKGTLFVVFPLKIPESLNISEVYASQMAALCSTNNGTCYQAVKTNKTN
ncbi:hypothetical protein [Neptuniibacter sp. QD37_11]|uniref:hypothetical protein n=1 Tax=Neptuniibacter sp. QD37_11 TaxID=3398209 RepID=UPI0039F4A3D0